jgi:hypothetical protein
MCESTIDKIYDNGKATRFIVFEYWVALVLLNWRTQIILCSGWVADVTISCPKKMVAFLRHILKRIDIIHF